ncbi:MAG: thioredoxin domain-containing protein [Halorubrum sp.]|uniref:DsbA family protein n=1 Tax=Halorubrum sp. TaxID=1879286 RepID=UPI00397068FB
MERTRRSLLAGAASVGVVGAAGCLGGGGNGGTDGNNTLETGEYDCDLSEPSDPDLDYRPVLGDPESDVVVQAFEDFTCGHCATYKLEHFPTIREDYIDPGTVRYEHWDFPIRVNETWAVPVASAARGVGARQDTDAFFEFASAAYESQGSYSGEAIGAAAEAAGADPCVAIADAQFAAYEEASTSDKSEGESMGVSGTPTIFVDGEPVDTYEAETIAAAIDEAL